MLRFYTMLGLLMVCSSLAAETVYLKPADALRIHFKDSTSIISEKKSLSPAQRGAVERELGVKMVRDEWIFHVAKTDSKVDGYAVVDHEIGRMEPITFMTFLKPNGEVQAVEILVYREIHGSEVRESRFLEQFENKRPAQSLIVGQDVRNISGATLSVRAVTLGVRRALAVWNALYSATQRGGSS